MARVAPGTQVVLEGPYGRFTADPAAGRPVLLIGAGVGLAPFQAVLAECRPEQRPILVAQVRDRRDIPHAEELRALVQARGGRLFALDGPRRKWNGGQPFPSDCSGRT